MTDALVFFLFFFFSYKLICISFILLRQVCEWLTMALGSPATRHILISWHTWNAWNEYKSSRRRELMLCWSDCRTATWFVVNRNQSNLPVYIFITVSWGMLFDTLKSSIIQQFSINHPQPCPERWDSRVGALDPFNGDDTRSGVFLLSSGSSGQVNVRYFLFVSVPHLPNGPAVWPLITFKEGLDDQVSESVTEACKGLKIRLMWNFMHVTWPLQLAYRWFQGRLFLFSN